MRLRVHRVLAALVLPLGVAATNTHGATSAKFPGGHVLRSPDGNLTVYSIPPSDGNGNHRLVIAEKGHVGTKDLLEFGRHVMVSWAPDSKHLAVTDYAGSDEASCSIVDPQTGTRVDLGEVAKATGAFEASAADHHRYMECDSWNGRERLRLTTRSWGDSNTKGLVEHGEYSLRGGFVRKRKG